MPPASQWANSTLQAFTVLLFCLTLVQGVEESANVSWPQNTDSNTSVHYQESVISGLGPAPAAQTNDSSVKNLVANLNVSSQQSLTEQFPDPHASKQLSEASKTAVALSDVLTQQDSCPADANAATAPHNTGTPKGSIESAHVDSIPPILHNVPAETQQAREQQQQQQQQQQQIEQQQQQHQTEQQQQSQQQQQDEVDTSSNDEDRHNFALSKDGAKIVACNKEAKKCSAILDTDSDTFMKNDCKADKWFIMELSQVAKVDAFQLSQYELYSSRVKEFEVRGRQTHPRGQGSDYSKALNTSGWQLLGRYTAAKSRGTQAFNVAKPVWLKYMQFHFITQYGTEPMCALNDILVHGKSAAEDLEDQLSASDLLPEEDVQPDKKPGDMMQPVDTAQKADVPPETALTESHDSSASPVEGAAANDRPAAQDAEAVLNTSGNVSTHNGEYVPAAQAAETVLNASGNVFAHDDSDTQLLEQPGPHSNATLPNVSSQADVASAQLKPHNSSASDAAAAIAASKPAGNAQGTDAMHEELLLLPNSASSNKARHGGSIYDMLVQEIKSLKLQQKLAPRQLAELQKNMSAYINKTSAELHALQLSVQLLQSELDILRQEKNTTEQSESSESIVTESPDAGVDAELDLHAVHRQLEVVKAALHIVQHRVTAIVLMAMVAWLAVMVLTAPDLGRMTWILYVPITMISAIGVLWLAGVLRILPTHFTLQ